MLPAGQFPGCPCRLRLRIGGAAVRVTSELSWTESATQVSWLQAAYLSHDGPGPEMGALVELQWARGDDHSETTLRLWCAAAAHEHASGNETVRVTAVDPLGFCAEEPQFRSYPGRLTLPQLAHQILAFQPGRLEQMQIDNRRAGALPVEYLLQCRESGAEFLRRVAAAAGCAVYWARERLAFADLGSAPGTRFQLELGDRLLWISRVVTPEPSLAELGWVDAESRTGRAAMLTAPAWAHAAGAPGLARPARTLGNPSPNAWVGEGMTRPWSGSLRLVTTEPAIALGDLVEAGRVAGVVESIVHHVVSSTAGQSYYNEVSAVPATRWAVPRRAGNETLTGPYQAVVSENDDPERLGRLRVALSEDPERRVTPWLPCLTMSAGDGLGMFWMPEKGNLVLCAAPAACPEALVVLGAIRGSRQRIAASWRTSDNARKVFAFRNGTSLLVDDQKRIIRFETPKSTLEMDGTGHLKSECEHLGLSARQVVDLTGRERVDIDGSRINLGK